MKNTKLKKKTKRKENETRIDEDVNSNKMLLVGLQFIWYILIFGLYYWIIAMSGGPKLLSAITTGNQQYAYQYLVGVEAERDTYLLMMGLIYFIKTMFSSFSNSNNCNLDEICLSCSLKGLFIIICAVFVSLNKLPINAADFLGGCLFSIGIFIKLMNDFESSTNTQKLWENSIAECILFIGWSVMSLNYYVIALSLFITSIYLFEYTSQYLDKVYGVLYDNLEKKLNDVFENNVDNKEKVN